jgi:flagellar basal-body rod modification protein FlgD
MSPLSSTGATPPTLPSASGLGGAQLGRDEFLQLLVAQLRNQDPTSPQDGHEFAAQLAQFSQVEQLTNINDAIGAQADQLAALAGSVDGLHTGQADMAHRLGGRIDLQSATALIGQTVEMAGATVVWDGATAIDVPVRLDGAAREVELTIRDAGGAVVRTLRTGSLEAGPHAISWDGALPDGSPAPAGAYSISVSAVGSDGQPIDATAVTTGTVERITVDADGVALWIDGRPLAFDALLAVLPAAS